MNTPAPWTENQIEAIIWYAQRNELRALPEYVKPQPPTHAECRAMEDR